MRLFVCLFICSLVCVSFVLGAVLCCVLAVVVVVVVGVRGESLAFVQNEPLRKHLLRMFSSIKNEGQGVEDIKVPSVPTCEQAVPRLKLEGTGFGWLVPLTNETLAS